MPKFNHISYINNQRSQQGRHEQKISKVNTVASISSTPQINYLNFKSQKVALGLLFLCVSSHAINVVNASTTNCANTDNTLSKSSFRKELGVITKSSEDLTSVEVNINQYMKPESPVATFSLVKRLINVEEPNFTSLIEKVKMYSKCTRSDVQRDVNIFVSQILSHTGIKTPEYTFRGPLLFSQKISFMDWESLSVKKCNELIKAIREKYFVLISILSIQDLHKKNIGLTKNNEVVIVDLDKSLMFLRSNELPNVMSLNCNKKRKAQKILEAQKNIVFDILLNPRIIYKDLKGPKGVQNVLFSEITVGQFYKSLDYLNVIKWDEILDNLSTQAPKIADVLRKRTQFMFKFFESMRPEPDSVLNEINFQNSPMFFKIWNDIGHKKVVRIMNLLLFKIDSGPDFSAKEFEHRCRKTQTKSEF